MDGAPVLGELLAGEEGLLRELLLEELLDDEELLEGIELLLDALGRILPRLAKDPS